MNRLIITLLYTLTISMFLIGHPPVSVWANQGDGQLKNRQKGTSDPLSVPAQMSPIANKTMMNDIAVAGKRMVAVGVRGHIVFSDNNGETWTQSNVPVSVDLTAVFFPTPDLGWAVGHDGVILHSRDGGKNWIKQMDGVGACSVMEKYYSKHPPSIENDPEGTYALRDEIQFIVQEGPVNPFLDVFFLNESTGFVVGAFNLIFRTDDGGKNWVPWYCRTENPMGFHLYCIRSAGGDIFIAGEQGLLLKLDKEAGLFRSVETPYTGTYFGLLGTSDLLLAFGMRGNVFRSEDGGENWYKVETGLNTGILDGTIMPNGAIVLITQAGQIIMSIDSGKKFTEIEGAGGSLHAVSPLDGNKLVMASWTGVQKKQI